MKVIQPRTERMLQSDEPYFIPNICRDTESTINHCPHTGVRKKQTHTIQIQNEENLKNRELNIIKRR